MANQPVGQRRRRGVGRFLVPVLLATGLVAAGLLAASVLAREESRRPVAAAAAPVMAAPAAPAMNAPAADDAVIDRAPVVPVRPTPAPSKTRLLPLVEPPEGQGGYAFATLEPGAEVARFDPCRSIEVVVNPAGAPSGWKRLVNDALASASTASGLSIRLVGTTPERPSPAREPIQPGRNADGWAPVLIAWSDEKTIPGLAGEVLGLGGPTWYGTKEDSMLVTGFVYLDGPGLAGTAIDLTAPVLAHEVGHLLGLDHIDDPAQLMYPRVRPDVPQYRDGDLRGLADAGSGPCAAAP